MVYINIQNGVKMRAYQFSLLVGIMFIGQALSSLDIMAATIVLMAGGYLYLALGVLQWIIAKK